MAASSENVIVAVRCRPLNKREIGEESKKIVNITDRRNVIINDIRKEGEVKNFTFDLVFGDDCQQQQIYDATARKIVDAVLEGFNGTVFAYGQTGTGKTFTMQGDSSRQELKGIIPNSFTHIFDHIAHTKNKKFLVRASYMEIYNEEIRDLLTKPPIKAINQTTRSLELKEHPETGVYVKELSSFIVKDVQELEKLMNFGNQNRSVGATLMNEVSSRSHSILTITLESSEEIEGQTEVHYRVGKLHLVDLAGSERQSKTGATGDRLKEATKINLSLSALGNCISALVDGKSSHIPYRDSKLTRLLQDALGGNAKTLMIATISPASFNFEETFSTLRYANRAKNIQNKPKINEDPKDALLRQYQEEINRLQKELEKRKSLSQNGQANALKTLKQIKKERSLHDLADYNEEDIEEADDYRNLDSEDGDNKVSLLKLQDDIEKEKRALEESKNVAAEEKQRMAKELELRATELEAEKQAREALSAQLRDIQSKLLIGGKNIQDHVKEQERVLRQTQLALEEQNRKEHDLQLKLQEKQGFQIQLEESYQSLQDEVDSKTKKLNKLIVKLDEAKAEIADLQDEFREERENLLDSIRELSRTLSLKVSIIENFVPIDDRLKIERRAVYDEDADDWYLNPLPKSLESNDSLNGSAVNILQQPISSSKQQKVPISLYAKRMIQNNEMNMRYRKENIWLPELDLPERTTFDLDEYSSMQLQQQSFNASQNSSSKKASTDIMEITVSSFVKKSPSKVRPSTADRAGIRRTVA